jgi:hypothetical protein
MSKTISRMCVLFMLFSVPATIIRLSDQTFSQPLLHVFYFYIHYAQYSVHFVIYAASNEQYQKAYAFFFSEVICCCRRRRRRNDTGYLPAPQDAPYKVLLRRDVTASRSDFRRESAITDTELLAFPRRSCGHGEALKQTHGLPIRPKSTHFDSSYCHACCVDSHLTGGNRLLAASLVNLQNGRRK